MSLYGVTSHAADGALEPTLEPSGRPAAVADLLVVGGPSAGLRVPLAPGEHRVGSHPYSTVMLRDPGLARFHLVVAVGPAGEVGVTDAGSQTGSFLDGVRLTAPATVRPDQVVVAGQSLLAFVPSGALPPAQDVAARARGRVDLEPPPGAGWASPAAVRAYRDRVAALDRELAEARAAESARLRAITPDAVQVLELARSATPGVPRGPGDANWLTLRVGWGDVSSEMAVEPPAGGNPTLAGEAARVLGRHRVLNAVPLTASLADVGTLGLAGDGAQVEGLCRWLAAQLAVLHSPESLRLAAASGDPAAWSWLGALPHAREPLPGLTGSSAGAEASSLLEALVGLLDTRQRSPQATAGPSVVVFLDQRSGLSAATLPRLLIEGPAARLHLVCLAEDASRLPTECRAVLEAPAGRPASLRFRRRGVRYQLGGVDAIAPEQAADVVRALQRPRSAVAELSDVLDLDGDLQRQVLESWIRSRATTGPRTLRATCGMGGNGTLVSVDLRETGHLLVTGAAGTGKSDVLRLLAVGLAARHPPSALRLVVLDGHGSLEPCAGLPHVAIWGSGEEVVRDVLGWLGRDVGWREQVLRQEGAGGLGDIEQADPDRAPARLVVLLDEVPEQLSGGGEDAAVLSTVGREGRRLGIHLVLSRSAVGDLAEMDLPGARVALGGARPGESQALVGTPAADDSGLPRGRGFLGDGPGAAREVHVPVAVGAPLTRVVDAIGSVAQLLGPRREAAGE
jgi:S-DNA-T family DNA segregation ATPase FtsK/SpoIIIE